MALLVIRYLTAAVLPRGFGEMTLTSGFCLYRMQLAARERAGLERMPVSDGRFARARSELCQEFALDDFR